MLMSGTRGLSFEDRSLQLPGNRPASLHYTFNPAPKAGKGSRFMLVCLNGLMTPQASWFPALFEFAQLCKASNTPRPSILTYDRWLQGRTTDADPRDSNPGKEPEYGHDILDVVHDLHHLLLTVARTHHLYLENDMRPPVIFLANSIGCATARLYAATYPGSVHAYIFLDSIIAHTDFVSIWPDPDAPSFDPAAALPPGVDIPALRAVRAAYAKIFHPSAPNPEHLDRRSLPDLLPSPSIPPLPRVALTGAPPLLVVVGHDPDTFAKEGEERLGTPPALTLRYAQTSWHEYNEGLVKLTNAACARGPVIAKGCSHFVQKDGPGFVASIMVDVLGALVEGRLLKRWDEGDVAAS